jgi:hypothetical protein
MNNSSMGYAARMPEMIKGGTTTYVDCTTEDAVADETAARECERCSARRLSISGA